MPTQPKPVYIDIPEGIKGETTPTFTELPDWYIPKNVWNTPYNYIPEAHLGEINNQPSMTIPNETYTIRELMERFTKGIDPEVQREGVYGEEEVDFDSPDLQQIHQMDLYDVQQHLTKTKKLIEQLDENYKSQQHSARQQQAEKDENVVKVKQGNVENEQK